MGPIAGAVAGVSCVALTAGLARKNKKDGKATKHNKNKKFPPTERWGVIAQPRQTVYSCMRSTTGITVTL